MHARKSRGWSQAQLVRELLKIGGPGQSVVSKIEQDNQENTAKHLTALSNCLGVNSEWLRAKIGPMERSARPATAMPVEYGADSGVRIRHYKSGRVSNGNGAVNDDSGEVDVIYFKQSYIEKNGLTADRCFAMYASGDSNWPTINDGDLILINEAETDLFSGRGKLFAFETSGELLMKRVFPQTTGSIRLASDNPDKTTYPDEIVSEYDAAHLRVLGRVRWSGGDK